MAKDQVVKRARQKNTDTTVQDIGPTQEQLEQLAKQEETMRARALERMRTSQAKMAQLRLRDESEKKKKEQDKWEKRDEKLRKFLDHQRALLLQGIVKVTPPDKADTFCRICGYFSTSAFTSF